MTKADLPLWTPSDERIAATNMVEFMDAVQRDHDVDIAVYDDLYNWSIDQPEAFWQAVWDLCGVIADGPGNTTIEDFDKMPGARWFPSARLNFAENLLRRRDSGPALIFSDELRQQRTLSHGALYDEVSRLAQALADCGVGPGDRVAGFMPNLPETAIAMLATTSRGAIWSSCSPDFGIKGVMDRFGQIAPKVLFTADGYHYGGKTLDSLARARALTEQLPNLEQLIVVPYLDPAPKLDGLEAVLLEDFIAPYTPEDIHFMRLPFNAPLYILYSSGTTGVPKCIVHGIGGTLIQHLKEHRLHCNIKRDTRVFYFTTCGWMMWNWLMSALASEATLVLYDGSPFHDDGRVLFDLADTAGINVFGISAKFIDACNKARLEPARTHSLASIDTILSTGSSLKPEGFDYAYQRVKTDVQLSSMSGGTDLIGCFVSGNPTGPVWRGEIQVRALGMKVEVFDESGVVERGEKGELVCTAPFPSMPIGFWADPDGAKYHAAYFEVYPNVWCHGDYVALTEHGGMIIYGRSDAVLNPGGVRIGTAEIYREVEQISDVVEGLVIGQEWDDDTRVVLFVKLRDGLKLNDALSDHIKRRIRENTTPRHVPARIVQVADIPRTISGKIVELAVRDVVHGREVKNVDALANPEALDHFKDRPELRH